MLIDDDVAEKLVETLTVALREQQQATERWRTCHREQVALTANAAAERQGLLDKIRHLSDNGKELQRRSSELYEECEQLKLQIGARDATIDHLKETLSRQEEMLNAANKQNEALREENDLHVARNIAAGREPGCK